MANQQLSTNTFGVAKWIVSATASDGTHTTIASALTSASSGDTIFIRPGTYTENLTLKAGVNLTAFGSDSSYNQTGKVIISGKATFTAAGSVTISGIQLQTNSDFLLAVTGSAASIVNLNNCDLNCTNNTGISFTTSSASGKINIVFCTGDLGTTGIGLWSSSSAGTIFSQSSYFTNTGASTTVTTNSAGAVNLQQTTLSSPVSTTSTGGLTGSYYVIDSSAQNAIPMTANGSGASSGNYCFFNAGTASDISVGTGATFIAVNCVLQSSNTNAATGAGTFTNDLNTYPNTSTINTTTINFLGTKGIPLSTAPAAGTIGEQIRSGVTSVSVTNNTLLNVTSINITAGIWDVSAAAVYVFTGASTDSELGISTNTASFTGTVLGDSHSVMAITGTANNDVAHAVPSFRVSLSSTVTYYLVGYALFSTGACTTNGRISATRVA